VDDGLLDANPFARVKLRLDDDSAAREVLTRQDLAALFDSVQDAEEWWLFRIGLFTGARLGEICQLTKSDCVTVDGVPCLHIREDAEAGKRVKNRGSVRKVPIHRQLIADGVLDWIAAREGEALFTMPSPVASKRLNRRMRAAKLGPDKPFHALRHTFKSAARRVMGAEWHDRITGHAHRTVGETYGDYDLGTLKGKIDLIAFGVETPAGGQPPAPT
jgi:integrase